MDPIEAAIAAIESREPGEGFPYNKIAALYGVSRSTLSRRHQGSQGTETKDFNQLALNPQQEHELVIHIERLTNKGLPPTREMVINICLTGGSPAAFRDVGYSVHQPPLYPSHLTLEHWN
jgi:hypothetical protein